MCYDNTTAPAAGGCSAANSALDDSKYSRLQCRLTELRRQNIDTPDKGTRHQLWAVTSGTPASSGTEALVTLRIRETVLQWKRVGPITCRRLQLVAGSSGSGYMDSQLIAW